MSASTDRKKRQEAIQTGTDRKTQAQLEEIKKKKKSKANWTFGTIIVVLLVAAILILNSNLFYTGTKAVTIGDENYNAAQFSYYFKTQYYNFVQQYNDYISYIGLDTKSPLKDQKCNMIEDGTWYDYFKQQAITMMTQVTAMSEYAEKNGITLDDTDKAGVDSTMADFAQGATSNSYSSTKNYLIALFGRGCDEKLVRGELERSALASKAYNAVMTEYEDGLTAADLEANYTENKDSYDVFDYDYYLVAAETVVADDTASAATGTDADTAEPQAAVTDETMAAAKVKADAIAAKAKTGSLDDAVKGVVADGSASQQTNVSGSNVTGDYAEWLKSADRHAGDVTVVESANSGYYVVKFNGRGNNHYAMAQVRHILIKAVASEDGTYTDDAKATAKAKAQEIYDQWLAGDKTEESFASLATEYSEDEGSKDNGGLYDTVYKGRMVKDFEAFCFAAGRKTGDTGIVYGEASGSYAGYHVMYYVGAGDMYSSYLAKNNMAGTYMSTWTTDLVKNYSSAEHFSLRFAG